MPHELEKQIEEHLSVSPAKAKRLETVEEKLDNYMNKAMWIMLGFVGSILAIGVWVGTMQTNIENIVQDHNKVDNQLDNVERRLGLLEVTNSEIKARLSSIDVTLQEIKVAIKAIR